MKLRNIILSTAIISSTLLTSMANAATTICITLGDITICFTHDDGEDDKQTQN